MGLCDLLDDRAIKPQSHDIYAHFGVYDRQIELVARAMPKRH